MVLKRERACGSYILGNEEAVGLHTHPDECGQDQHEALMYCHCNVPRKAEDREPSHGGTSGSIS